MRTLRQALRPILDHWTLAAACAAAAMLAIAHAFQRFGGLAPCTLCFYQRDVYWAAFSLGLFGFFIGYVRLRWTDRAVAVLLALVFLVGAGIAAYHSGVEWKWWPGPTTCTGAGAVDAGELGSFLGGARIKPPRCDEAPWRLIGLSMAGWNALISLGLTGLSLAAARKDRTRD
jgi:disulfide bond formation protein DsbB